MLAMIKAVLWDFGGVILASPFEAFRRYETEHGLPVDFIRSVNTTNPHANAWALLGTQRDHAGASSTPCSPTNQRRSATGSRAPTCCRCWRGDVRPEMVAMLDRVKAAGYRTACLTNNVVGGDGRDRGRRACGADRRDHGSLRRDRREQQGRRAQTRAALLRDRLRVAGRGTRGSASSSTTSASTSSRPRRWA